MKPAGAVMVFILVSVLAIAYINYEYGKLPEKATRDMLPDFADDIDLAALPDGIYIGREDYVTLEIEVVNHRIIGVNILRNKGGDYAASAERIAERVVSAQSLWVDTISGATFTSEVILSAIASAASGGVSDKMDSTPETMDTDTGASPSWVEEQDQPVEITKHAEFVADEPETSDVDTGASSAWTQGQDSSVEVEGSAPASDKLENSDSISSDHEQVESVSSTPINDVISGASQQW